jgi:hypothetical protein
MDLSDIVAQMRALGVTHYEHQDSTRSFKVTLGPAPARPSPDVGEVPLDAAKEAAAGEASASDTPDPFRRLPLAYRNPMLYGGKLPDLGK